MLLKKGIVILLLLLLNTSFNSQNCDLVLKGVVMDDDNSEHLGFAVVKLINTGEIKQTNSVGEFTFENLCSDNYQILVQHVGCKDTIFNFLLNKSRKIIFKLPHSLNALSDVEIITHQEKVKPTQVVATLDAKALDKTRGQSLGDQLKQLNGVSTFNTGPTISKPMINGMQGYRILVLNNGVRQEGQQWGNEHAPEIDPFVAQNLSVIRGSSAVRYGSDAMGGVVLVEPGPLPDTASIAGEFNLVGFTNGRGGSTSLMLQGYFDRIKYLSWRVQGSVRKNGSLNTPDYLLKNTAVDEQNYSYGLDYHRKKFGMSLYYSQFNSKVGIFSGAHIGNLTDLTAAFNRSKPQDSLAPFSYELNRPFQNIEHEMIRLSTDFHTGPRSRVNIYYAWQFNIRQEFDKHLPRGSDPNTLGNPESDYRLNTQTAEIFWEHDYIKSFRGKFGLQGMHQFNRYMYRFFIPNYINQTFGVFAIERHVKPKYELEAGARYDYKRLQSFYYIGDELQSPDLRFTNASFNVGGILKPVESFKATINLANAWRAPAVNELYSNGLHHGVGAIERGKTDLKTETCINLIGSAIFERKNLHAEIAGYHYRFKNFIYYLPGERPELTIRGAFPVFNYMQNDANISGADVLIKYGLTNFLDLNVRSMWVRGYNTDLNQHLIYIPADRYEVGFTVKTKDFKRFKDLYVEPSCMYVAKQTRIPPQVDFAAPPDAYFLFGLNVGTTLQFGKQILIFSLSITNAANTVYRDYLDRFRYYNDAVGTNYTLRLRVPLTIYDKK